MNAWEILGGLVATLSFLITFIAVIVRLNTSITKLACAVDSLKEYTASNTKCHEDFTRALSGHETRITVLEDWRRGVQE